MAAIHLMTAMAAIQAQTMKMNFSLPKTITFCLFNKKIEDKTLPDTSFFFDFWNLGIFPAALLYLQFLAH
jgi:hypothetical protein